MSCCAPSIIPVSFEIPAAELAGIGSEPKTWATLATDVVGAIEIEAVHLEIQNFDPTADSLVLYADPGRQLNLAGPARPVWSYHRSFSSGTVPSWLVAGPTLTNGYRAECRLPLVMAPRNLRLWTDQTGVTLLVSGSVFYRPIRPERTEHYG